VVPDLMAATIKLNQQALKSIAIAGSAADLKVRANRVLNAARRGAPVDRGPLRASLAIQYRSGPQNAPVARIGSNLPYAIYVHEGTGIYGPRGAMIRPRRAPFMVWTPRGSKRAVFAKQTKGMKGRPFLLNALKAAK
jgi:phage gpG-like protein